MRNDSVLTLKEFKEQIVSQIKKGAPSSTVTPDNVVIKVKLDENSEPVDFHSFKITISF